MIVATGMLVACGKGSGGTKFTHDEPHFTVSHPADLVPGKDQIEAGSGNLSIRNERGDRELFFVWAPIGSDYDPWGQLERYRTEGRVLEQGDLPPNGKFVVSDREGRIYIHKIITTGNGEWGVLCMASTSDMKKDKDLIDACKSLELN